MNFIENPLFITSRHFLTTAKKLTVIIYFKINPV